MDFSKRKKSRSWKWIYWTLTVPLIGAPVLFGSVYTYTLFQKEKFSALDYWSPNFKTNELLYYSGNRSLQINKTLDDFYDVASEWGNEQEFFAGLDAQLSILANFGVDQEETPAYNLALTEFRPLRKQIATAVLTFDYLAKESKDIAVIKKYFDLAKDLFANMKFIVYSSAAVELKLNNRVIMQAPNIAWTVEKWFSELNYHWNVNGWAKSEKLQEIQDSFPAMSAFNLTSGNEAGETIVAYMLYMMSLTSPTLEKVNGNGVLQDDEITIEDRLGSRIVDINKNLPNMFWNKSPVHQEVLYRDTKARLKENPNSTYPFLIKFIEWKKGTEFAEYFNSMNNLAKEIEERLSNVPSVSTITVNGKLLFTNFNRTVSDGRAKWDRCVANANGANMGGDNFIDDELNGYFIYRDAFATNSYERFLLFDALVSTFGYDITTAPINYLEAHAQNSSIFYGGNPFNVNEKNGVFNERIEIGKSQAFPLDFQNVDYEGEGVFWREYAGTSHKGLDSHLKSQHGLEREITRTANTIVKNKDFYWVDPVRTTNSQGVVEKRVYKFDMMTDAHINKYAVSDAIRGSSLDIDMPTFYTTSSGAADIEAKNRINLAINAGIQGNFAYLPPINVNKSSANSSYKFTWHLTRPSGSNVLWEGPNYYGVINGITRKFSFENDVENTSVGTNKPFSFKRTMTGEIEMFDKAESFNEWIKRTYANNLFLGNSNDYSLFSETKNGQITKLVKVFDKNATVFPSPQEYIQAVSQASYPIMNSNYVVYNGQPYELRSKFRKNKYVPTLP